MQDGAKAIATRDIAVQVSVPIWTAFRREARLDEQDAVVRGSQCARPTCAGRSRRGDAALSIWAPLKRNTVAREQLRLAESELSQGACASRPGSPVTST